MTAPRCLIVNADDFGQTAGINRGIIAAHERGIVTSASLMVRWPAAAEAAAYCKGHPELSLGLHLDLGEWAFRDGSWVPRYEVVPLDDPAVVEHEVYRQLDHYRRLVGREPTHIDSHQHVHLREPVKSVVVRATRQAGAVLRHLDPEVRYCGDFYGQTEDGSPYPEGITVEALVRTLTALRHGVTELACHPSEVSEPDTMYGPERVSELQVLTDPRVRQAIAALGIKLCSFHNAVSTEGQRGAQEGQR
jgi:predicted glycoside hydrolase/deacetylase ChbG (UPF0249 family)